MKIELFEDNWSVDDVKKNVDKVFVFGDNNLRVGKGGQAIIRNLTNTVGVRTKKGPSDRPIAFFNDSEYDQNVLNMREDILNIKLKQIEGSRIVLSKNGYGTGLAQMEKFAPKTFFKLCQLLLGHFDFDNLNGSIKKRIPGYDEIVAGTYVSLDNKKFDSNVLAPINNSYFKKEYLEKNINTIFDLVKNQKKIAFTYPIHHNLGDIVIFSVNSSSKYLVCRVVDSYDYREVSHEMWSIFEGFDVCYIKNLKLINEGQILYQNHFEFICTLEEDGKMEFNSILFGDKIENPKDVKVVGQNLTSTEVTVKNNFL